MSRIVTFYSYKGGVGRTFALANIAVLLAKRGKRVLIMDWDLEAPGLHRYFERFLQERNTRGEGLIHLLWNSIDDPNVDWRNYIIDVDISDCQPISLIPSGDSAIDYAEKVRGFSWNYFFEKGAGGNILDRWRREWKQEYDFVLVDSRTGITDTGGVCTIYLPDFLVLVFAANEQSFEMGKRVISGAQKARAELAVPRPPLTILPLVGRFDGRDEVDEAQKWLNRFSNELKSVYDDWLPTRLHPRQILELTKIPYVAKFSFGEPLPVIDHGITDPEFPGFYLDKVTELLVSDFQDVDRLVPTKEALDAPGIAELRGLLTSASVDEAKLAELIEHVERQIGSSPVLAELLTEVGVTLLRQRRLDAAEQYFRRSMAVNSESKSPSRGALQSTRNYLADLLLAAGRLSEALSLYEQIAADAEDAEDITSQLSAYTNLASVHRRMGNLAAAASLYNRVLAVSERLGRPEDQAILATYNNLASLAREMGRDEEAIAWYRRGLDVAERNRRPGDPIVTATYNNLAMLYREKGQDEDAISLYRRALDVAEVTADLDPAIAATYNNLAAVYREMGRDEDAIALYRQALDVAERYGRPGDPTFTATCNNLAALYREMGRHEDASGLYRRALNVAERYGRPGDPAITATSNNLAALYREMGRHEDAIAVYRQALDGAEQYGRPGDAGVIATYNNLAALYRELGRDEDAIYLYRRALQLAERYGRPGDPTIIATYNNLADILVERGHLHEAEQILRRGLAGLGSILAEESPIGASIRSKLSSVLRSSGRVDEAVEVAQKTRVDAFISYNSVDLKLVQLLATLLSEKGVRVWFDRWAIRPGDNIALSMSEAYASSAVILICVGKSEIINPPALDKPIIPIILPGSNADRMPFSLRSIQYLDMRGGIDESSVDKLITSIRRVLRSSSRS